MHRPRLLLAIVAISVLTWIRTQNSPAQVAESSANQIQDATRIQASVQHDLAGTCEIGRLDPSTPSFDLGFASTVAIDGDVAVVSSPNDTLPGSSERGAVYVFRFDGRTWVQEARLNIDDYYSRFGWSVAVSGDVVLVGAPDDNASSGDCGAIYVYRFDGVNWVQEDVLRGNHPYAWCRFGASVALHENVAVVGAPDFSDEDGLFRESGAAFVYRFDGTEWVREAQLTAPMLGDEDRFGLSVAVDETQLVVGAPGHSLTDEYRHEGAAYVFRHNGIAWTVEAELTASDPVGDSKFGSLIAVRNDVAVVSAPRAPAPGCLNCGAAYIFRYDHGQWPQAAKLVSAEEYSWEYGTSVATDGELILVGAADESVTDDCWGECGATYLYRAASGAWEQAARLTAPDEGEMPRFGQSVGLDGGLAIVGAPMADCDPRDDQVLYCGAAYTYVVSGDDCNCNGEPDLCDLRVGAASDCNDNLIPDRCDIDAGTSEDCNADGVPNECDRDCQDNGVPDGCDIAAGTSADCNHNVVPDECELTGPDCNLNGIDDTLELVEPEVLLEETFPSETLDLTVWTFTGPGKPNLGGFPSRSILLEDGDGIETQTIPLRPAGTASLSFDARSAEDEAHPQLEVHYWDGATWQLLSREPVALLARGETAPRDRRILNLPHAALHEHARLRFSVPESRGYAGWQLDNIYLTQRERDCNGNGVLDSCEVSACGVEDCNENGIPDECDFETLHVGARADYSAGFAPQAIAADDFDGDGDIDLAIGRGPFEGDGFVRILLNNGMGVFTWGPEMRVGDWPRSIASGDLDGDGYPDLVAASASWTSWSRKCLLLNRGGNWWGFGEAENLPVHGQVRAVALGDLDSDGDLDIVTANGAYSVAMLVNSGGATFTSQHLFETADVATSLAVFDANRDGNLDIAWVDQMNNTVGVVTNAGRDSEGNWLGALNSTFVSARESANSVLVQPFQLTTADFDRDGFEDLVVAMVGHVDGMGVAVLRNLGNDASGAWLGLDEPRTWPTPLPAFAIAAADLNRDGWIDVAVAEADTTSTTGTLTVMLNGGEDEDGDWFGFEEPLRYEGGAHGRAVVAADLRGDGTMDLIVAHRATDSWGYPDGVASVSVFAQIAPDSADCNDNTIPDDCELSQGAQVDADGDGVPDLCQPDCNGNNLPDGLDLANGESADCNRNSVPDECDLAAGTSGDCNGNAIPDECDVRRPFRSSSGLLDWIVEGEDNEYRLMSPPPAATDVTITIAMHAYLEESGSYVDLSLNGSHLARLYDDTPNSCSIAPDIVDVSIAAETFNALVADTDAVFRLSSPSCCVCGVSQDYPSLYTSFAEIDVSYETRGLPDCDGNRVPDTCDVRDAAVDCNGNELPDACEVMSQAVFQSERLAPLGPDSQQWFIVSAPPPAIGPVTLAFEARGQLGGGPDHFGERRHIQVILNGTPIGAVYRHSGRNCPDTPDRANIILDPHEYNDLILHRDAAITLISDSEWVILPCNLTGDEHFVSVRLSYPYLDPALDCNANGRPDECDVNERDCNDNGVPDDCESDGDADGVPDECDACPDTALGGTITFGRCDTGVPDQVDDEGCPFSGKIVDCLASAKNHGEAVACITRQADRWRRDGAITGEQHGRITACAARKTTLGGQPAGSRHDGRLRP